MPWDGPSPMTMSPMDYILHRRFQPASPPCLIQVPGSRCDGKAAKRMINEDWAVDVGTAHWTQVIEQANTKLFPVRPEEERKLTRLRAQSGRRMGRKKAYLEALYHHLTRAPTPAGPAWRLT